MANVTDLTALAKTSVNSTHYLYVQNNTTHISNKIPVETLFPSVSTAGVGSETLYTSSVLTSKNQIVFKGIKSGDTGLLTVVTDSNNIVLTALEAGIDLSLCNNETSEFITGVDFTGTVTGECSVSNGGTGLDAMAKGSLFYASATDTISATTPMTTNGQLLIGNATTGYPSVATLTAGTNMIITNGAGIITLAATLATMAANLDMLTYNIDLNSNNAWISGSGLDEGITVDADGKVFMGEGAPTPHFDDALNLKGGIRFANTDAVTLNPNATTSATAGQPITIQSGNSASAAAGALNLTAGTASGSAAGGTVTITAGRDTGGSSDGTIVLKTYTGSSATAAMTIGSEGQDVTINTGDIIMSAGAVYMRASAFPQVIKYQPTPAITDDGTAAISTSNFLTGIITCTPSTDRVKALPTASDIVSDLSLSADGDSFDFTFINLAADGTALDVTLSGGTNITYVGNMHISSFETTDLAIATGSAQFRLRRTSATAVTCYRLS